jgi:hypothetical protein
VLPHRVRQFAVRVAPLESGAYISLEQNLAMKLTNLKNRIAAILPDERNPMSWTWAELLSALFVLVVAVFVVVVFAVARLL